jgi:Na+/proline symporter
MLMKSLFYIFWVLLAYEFYMSFITQSESEPTFLFFSLFGGLFAALFYFCIVYFSILGVKEYTPSPEESRKERFFKRIKQLLSGIFALIFMYAIINTVIENLIG